MSLLFNMVSKFVIAFLPRSKYLLISWLQSPSAVIFGALRKLSVNVSIVSPSICHEAMRPDTVISVFWMLSFKPAFSLSSFTFIKRLCSSSLLSALRVVSSAFVVFVQLLSCVWLFATPWTAAHQASLSITISQSLLKLISIESVMPSSCLVLFHSLLLPSIFPSTRVFSNESAFESGDQNREGSASASVLPLYIQDGFPLGLTGLISLQSKGLLRVFSNTTVQKHQFFSTQLYGPTLTSIHDYWKNQSLECMDLCWQSNVSAF